jgi:hypothetical protein
MSHSVWENQLARMGSPSLAKQGNCVRDPPLRSAHANFFTGLRPRRRVSGQSPSNIKRVARTGNDWDSRLSLRLDGESPSLHNS